MRRRPRGSERAASWAAAGLLLLGAAGAAAREHEAGAAHARAGHAAPGAASGHAAVEEHRQEFNWYFGLLGEQAGVEPGLLWRAPGTPVPFAAQLFNTLLLVGLLVRFAKQPIARGLVERRQRILRGIEDAAAMQAEATEQLRVYRSKLDNLDTEIERVRREMREAAESERRRALEEATARRTRLEQEARVLIERELEALREELTRETALAALESARELLKQNVSTDDHRRFCDQYLQTLAPEAAPTEVQRPSDPGRAAAARRSEAP